MVRVYDPFNAGESMPDSPFQAEISRASEQYGVDPGLINAVIRAESNYDPNAISPVGAQGLMQLMEGTAGDLGVEDRLDPSQNIQGGTQYLAQLAERFGGDVDKTLAAYNWGIGNIDRQGIENIPPETQEYLRKVKGFMGETPKTSSSAVRIYDPFKSEALDPQSAVRTYDPFRVEKMGIPKESDSENLGEKILKGVGTASMAATQFGLGVMNWTTRVFGSDIPHTLMGWSDPKYIHAIFKGGLSEDKTRQKGEGGKAYRERIKARKFVEEKKKSISKKRQIGYDIADILFSIPSDHPVFGFEDIEKGVRKVMHPVEWTLDKIMWPGHKIVDTLINKEKNPNAHAMFTSVSELGTFKAMHMAGKEAKWQTHKAKVRSRLREHLEKATVEDVKKVSEAGGLEGLADALREMEVKEKVPYIGDQYNAIRAAKVAADNTKGLAHAERQRSIKEAIDKVAAEAEKPEPKPTPKPLRTGVTAEEFMAGIKKEVPDAEKITQAVREVGKEERIEREAEGPVRVRDIEEGREKAEGEEIAKSLGEEVGGEISFDGEVEGLYYFTPKADIGGVAETRGATFATREPTIEAARESLKKIVDMRRPKEKAKFRIMRDDWPDTFGIGEGEKAGRIQEYFPETDEWKDVTGRTIGSNTETAWEAANRRLAEFIGMSEGTVKKFPVKEPKGITKLKNLFAETRSVRTVEAPKLDIIEGGKEEIPTFTQKKLAEDAGYTVVKQIHKTFEKAEKQRKRLAEEYGTIEGQEPPVVIKTGKSYRVATKETPLLDAEAEALVSEYFKEGEKTPYEEAETISTEEAMDRVKEIGEKILERTEEGGLKLKEGLNTNQHINEVKSLASMLDPNNPTHSNIIDFSEMILDKLGPKEKTREDFLREAEVEPDTTKALRLLLKAIDIVRNEKGAIEIERLNPEMQERLRKVIADSLKVGKPVKEYMKDLGYDEKTASTFDKASELFKEKRPVEELDKKVITPMEEGVNVSSRKSRKVRGIEVNYLPVFYEELKTLMKSKELQERTGVGEYFRNPIRAFREAGSGLKKMIYEPYVNAEKLVVRDLKAKETTIKALRKGISRRSAKRIWKFAMAQQTGGPEIMTKMKIKKIPKSLTPKEMKAYEGLRAEYDILFNRLNDVRTSIGKNPIRKVGDYFTFMSALSMLEKLGIKTNLILDRPSVIRDRYTQFKATPFRFARARAKAGMAPVVTDPFVIYSRYANSAIRHLHISPIVAKVGELRRVFKLEDGSNWKLGASNQKPRLDKFLLDWSNFLAGQTEFKLPPRIERALGMINRNLTYSVLGANARSALIQISASKNTFVEIGATHTAKGWVSSLRPGAEARILKKSNLEQRVYDAVVGDAMAALKTGKVGGVKKVIASGAMWPLKYLDLRTAMATWDGAYKLAKDKMKMGENRAVEYANDVVTRTQASALQGDLAPVQRTALGKFMTLFQTFVINDWNFLTEDVLGMKNAKITNPIAVKKVLKFIAATTMTNVLFEDIIGVKSPLPTPLKALMKGVEDEDSTGRIALSIFMEMLEPIPVVSSARYGTSPFGPGVETIGELTKLMRDYPMQKPWYETLGKLMGVPGTTQVMKTKRAIERDASTKEKVFGAKYQPKKRRKKRPTSSGL